MNKLIDQLKSGKLLVSDGAWGTFLQAKGLQPGECPELWNIDRPDDVFDIAQSYVDAGSDAIETNSFGANRFKLEHYNLQHRAFEINKASAEISREAAGPDKFVLGSVGPTGKILMMGDVTEPELYKAFKEQCMGLEAGGVDAIVVETMSDLDEARIAVSAARENTKCEVICTMTFNQTPDGAFYTMMGVTPAQMVEQMLVAGASIIGSNCGNGIKQMIGIVKEIRSVNKEVPVFIQANAGAPIYKDGKTFFPESPVEMGEFIAELIHSGVNMVGGCCGTTPEHIKVIAEIVKNNPPTP
jgi:5-methyltetrahydrofolate--homocysteine methyltransferase